MYHYDVLQKLLYLHISEWPLYNPSQICEIYLRFQKILHHNTPMAQMFLHDNNQ